MIEYLADRFFINLIISLVSAGLIPAVGSSNNNNFGLQDIAIPNSNCLCKP